MVCAALHLMVCHGREPDVESAARDVVAAVQGQPGDLRPPLLRDGSDPCVLTIGSAGGAPATSARSRQFGFFLRAGPRDRPRSPPFATGAALQVLRRGPRPCPPRCLAS